MFAFRITPVLRHEEQIRREARKRNYVPAAAVIFRDCRRPLIRFAVMQVRSRCRIYPSPGQRQMLARTFGCARVVYTDCLRLRNAYHAAGKEISDTEVQRQVVTLAKQNPERAGQDARRAYRIWFDSMSGRRKGRKVGRPAFRRQHRRQSIRLTRNGFALRGERLYVAKAGNIKVAWSRALPSVPSSVTVTTEPDGRYCASFVVEREPTPLPARSREIGVDVGLVSLVVTSDGEIIGNPRFLRAKVGHRVAVLHRKVREPRLDHAHKTALRLVRDNQAAYAEDLCVPGLARTRPARSVHDASWSRSLRLIEEKAAQYGRTFARIGRFEPTSRMCSAGAVKDGPKPLRVRTWTRAACGTTHDRDVNAAENVLARGRRESLNARGGNVRPGLVPADPGETGTHRSAA
ncbi:MAG TPA: helix-turn-helix domain-containing protein [Streptosporangiaceae bacterium]|nr:helix-turn-helix domain-containing protein [Streptosporangiaceae bacterium]